MGKILAAKEILALSVRAEARRFSEVRYPLPYV